MPSTDEILAELASKHLGFDTLEHRHSGDDFREVASWGVKAALQAAYEAGRAEAVPNRRTRVAGGHEWVMALPDRHAEGGFAALNYLPAEVEHIALDRAPNPENRFLSTPDVARLVHLFGLRA